MDGKTTRCDRADKYFEGICYHLHAPEEWLGYEQLSTNIAETIARRLINEIPDMTQLPNPRITHIHKYEKIPVYLVYSCYNSQFCVFRIFSEQP